MTLDGRPVRTCNSTVTMAPNGTGTATCVAVYSLPPEQNPTVHQVVAQVSAYGLAMVSADLQRLAKDVADEQKRNRALQAPQEPTTAPTAGQPSAGPTTYPCREPAIGETEDGPGSWQVVNRGPRRLWQNYQEQITGNRIGREYQVQRPGRQPLDFDGVERVDGKLVFVEAKGNYIGLLKDSTFNAKGKLVVTPDTLTERVLEKRLEQLADQLAVVKSVPGARLRFVMAQQEALDKLKAFMKDKLAADLFDLVDWNQTALDYSFTGCQ
jgi:hypothetical protein